eukprot:5661712-Ditylum_brightwellii.AAC.1
MAASCHDELAPDRETRALMRHMDSHSMAAALRYSLMVLTLILQDKSVDMDQRQNAYDITCRSASF